MSAPEYTPQESRSSVKISMTAKLDPVVECKVYVGDTIEDVDAARELAVATFKAAVAAVRGAP